MCISTTSQESLPSYLSNDGLCLDRVVLNLDRPYVIVVDYDNCINEKHKDNHQVSISPAILQQFDERLAFTFLVLRRIRWASVLVMSHCFVIIVLVSFVQFHCAT